MTFNEGFAFEEEQQITTGMKKVWIYYIVHRTQYFSNLRDPFAFALFLQMNTILQNLPKPVNCCMKRDTPPRRSQARKTGH